MLILGIDPGATLIGFGFVTNHANRLETAAYGCIRTNSHDPTDWQLKDLYQQLDKLIKKNRPEAMAVESMFFFKNQKTIVKVSQARGVIILAAANNSVPVFEYTPLQVKQAITGYGKAEKIQVQKMVKSILNLKEIPKPDDIADALAIAVCHANSYQYNKLIGH